MRLVWSAKACRRREEIFDYIAADNPKAALWLDDQFSQTAEKLAAFPYSGRIGRVAGTREVVVRGTYILVYEVESGRVVILTIFHAAQNMPAY